MSNEVALSIAAFPGDGIGHEVMASARKVLEALEQKVGGYRLNYTDCEAGADLYRRTGEALPQAEVDVARKADAILLGAAGLPEVRYPDGTEIAPQVELRFILNLYAGVRPIKALPGVPGVLADPRADKIDFVLVRESTEGLFAARGKGVLDGDREARDTMVITRETSERLFHTTFALARQRKAAGHPGRVTLIDKANVFTSMAFFRKVFDEVAESYRDIEADYLYVDAAALNFVRNPWDYDVMVTENMFGDILSDLGAGLIGGMGFAPSADIGDGHAVFQPAHGTAPDIAGQGKANPTAMFLSAAMMLQWLGEQRDLAPCSKAGSMLSRAVGAALSEGGIRTFDVGGRDGTDAVTDAVLRQLDVSD